ncbi:hypothetical protein, partial [Staphylococcus epidermidis]|uniref:hypothetical protein n=1 Tax=Staphylococcus epidermidis TaxID=1282 RepID=UPI001C92C4B5
PKTTNIPLIPTPNPHYLYQHHAIPRKILIPSQPPNPLNPSTLPQPHFTTTHQILHHFHFLPEPQA